MGEGLNNTPETIPGILKALETKLMELSRARGLTSIPPEFGIEAAKRLTIAADSELVTEEDIKSITEAAEKCSQSDILKNTDTKKQIEGGLSILYAFQHGIEFGRKHNSPIKIAPEVHAENVADSGK